MSEHRHGDKTLQALEPDTWPETLRAVVEDMNGRPLNIHKLMANRAPLLEAWWPFRNYIVSGGALGLRQSEIVILRTAVHAGAAYEWDSHVDRGHAAGLTLEEIDRIRIGPDAGWNERDAALIRAVDELHGDTALSGKTTAALTESFGESAALDLIAIHGTYMMLAMMLRTWPVELDEHVVENLARIKKAPT